jgi:hypothetical protein
MNEQGNFTYKTWINTFIAKLITDLLWDKIGCGWILANKDANASYINIKSPAGSKIALIGTLTPTNPANAFVAYEGWQNGDGGAGRALNTQIVPTNFGGGFTENACGISIYSRINIGGTYYDAGCGDTLSDILVAPRSSDGKLQNYINCGVGGTVAWTAGTPNSSGLHTVMRMADNNVRSYMNTVLYKSLGITSVALNSTRPLYLLAMNYNNSVLAPSIRQISLCLVHGKLDNTELSNLNINVAWLMANTPAGNKAV